MSLRLRTGPRTGADPLCRRGLFTQNAVFLTSVFSPFSHNVFWLAFCPKMLPNSSQNRQKMHPKVDQKTRLVPKSFRECFCAVFGDLGPSKMSFSLRRRAKIHVFTRSTLFTENARKSLRNSLRLGAKM